MLGLDLRLGMDARPQRSAEGQQQLGPLLLKNGQQDRAGPPVHGQLAGRGVPRLHASPPKTQTRTCRCPRCSSHHPLRPSPSHFTPGAPEAPLLWVCSHDTDLGCPTCTPRAVSSPSSTPQCFHLQKQGILTWQASRNEVQLLPNATSLKTQPLES
jgi:hypothetical protein